MIELVAASALINARPTAISGGDVGVLLTGLEPPPLIAAASAAGGAPLLLSMWQRTLLAPPALVLGIG
jgi:hypothetical protein